MMSGNNVAVIPATAGIYASGWRVPARPGMSSGVDLSYVVALADDALVLGHRLSEWSGKGRCWRRIFALSIWGWI